VLVTGDDGGQGRHLATLGCWPVHYQLLTALPNCWRSRRSWVHQIGMVMLVADGVALLGLFLAPRPRMGGGSHRCSERVREGLAQFIGVPRGLCFISKPPGSKKKDVLDLKDRERTLLPAGNRDLVLAYPCKTESQADQQ
jgi:hypothetical protein